MDITKRTITSIQGIRKKWEKKKKEKREDWSIKIYFTRQKHKYLIKKTNYSKRQLQEIT